MSSEPFLRGGSVTLHPMEPDDLTFARDLLNDPDVRAGLTASTPQTLESERTWWDGLGDDDHPFVLRADDRRVGVIGYHESEEPWGLAEVGYFVDPDHWGKGYATDALDAVLRYAFDERRCNKVEANAYATNEASKSVLETAGFEREGVRRRHCFVDGEYVDLHEYGLLADEWRE